MYNRQSKYLIATDRSVVRTTDTALCTTNRVNSTTDRVVRTNDSVNILTDRMKVYNGLFLAPTAYNRPSDGYNWKRKYLYHSISMNAEYQEETY